MSTSGAKVASAILASVFVLALAACGGQESVSNDAPQDSGKRQTAGTSAQNEANRVAGETTRAEATASERGDGVAGSGEIAELAKAEVGLKEITNMIPADGKKPDPGRQLPKDPPEGIKVYPATINRSVRGSSSTIGTRRPTATTLLCGKTVVSTRSPYRTGTPSTA